MSTTKAVRDSRSFLELLEKSGLLDDQQLETARTLGGAHQDARSVARLLVKDELLTAWQAAQLLAGWFGLTIGKYRLLRQLGKSGLGRVFLAEHTQMGRTVALKTLSKRYTSQPEIVERFLSDARTAAALDHRNIVHVYDIDSADDRFMLVMEHVEGQDLRSLVSQQGPLDPVLAARYIRQATQGLAYAHQRGLLHGDLRPANVMVDQQGIVKILGLGLARLSQPAGTLEADASDDSSDDEPDASGLIAPELRNAGGALTASSDVFGVGACFYFLLTGKLPTAELGPRDLLRRRPDLPTDLARICARMMAADTAKRLDSVTTAGEALDAWLAENAPAEPLAEDLEQAAADQDRAVPQEDDASQGEEIETFDWSPGAAPVIVDTRPTPARKSAGRTKSKAAGRADATPPESAKIEPANTTPAGTTPAGSNPAGTEPAGPKPAGTEPAGPNGRGKRRAESPADANPRPAAGKQKLPRATPLEDAPAKPADRRSKSTSPATAEPATNAAGTVADGGGKPKSGKRKSPPATSGTGRPLPLGLIIGGAAGGVLVLGLIGLLIFLLVGRGGSGTSDDQLAQANPAAAETSGSDLETDPESSDSLETDPEDPLESDPQDPLESDPKTTPDTSEQPASTGQPGATGQPDSTPATTDKPADPAGTPANPAGTPDGQGTGEPPAEKPGPPADSNQPQPEQPQPEPAKPEPAKPEQTKPPEAKPPAKPKPPVKPFAGFAEFVSLPGPSADAPPAPYELGPIRVPEGLICFIKLRGGKDACKGPVEFSMVNARGGTSETEWEIFLDGSRSGQQVKLADLTLKDGKLRFQWTAEAAAESNAEYLVNCALSMNVGPELHDLRLRQPVPIEPLVLDLEKSGGSYKLPIQLPPEPTAVKIQLVKLEGPFPPHVLEPDGAVPAEGGEQTIKLGQKAEDQVLDLRIDSDLKRDVQLTITPYFRWPLENKPVKLGRGTVRKYEQQALAVQAQTVAGLEQLRRLEKQAQPAAREAITQQISLGEQQLQKLGAGIQALEKLKSLGESLNQQGRLHYRVFYDADGIEVDLARPQAAP